MSNKVLTVWLIALTVWLGYNSHISEKNREVREKVKQAQIENFNSLSEFINGLLNERIGKIEKHIDDNVGPYLHEYPGQ